MEYFEIEGIQLSNPFLRKKNESIQKLYEEQMAAFWVASEIKLDKDYNDYREKLNPHEKFYLKKIVAFFLFADDIIGENLLGRFISEIPVEECRRFLKFQLPMEDIHAQTYFMIFEMLLRDTVERDKAIQEILGMNEKGEYVGTAISEKIKWCAKWVTGKNSLAERIIGVICVEMVLFSSSFGGLYWFKSRQLLPGITYSNEKIAADEGKHGIHGIEMYFKLIELGIIEPLPVSRILEIFTDGAETEFKFVRESIPVPMLDMTAEKMCDYVKFVVDFTLSLLKVPKHYGAKNPFPFADLISIVGKTDFFIRQVSEYTHTFQSYEPNDDQIDQFDMNSDDE